MPVLKTKCGRMQSLETDRQSVTMVVDSDVWRSYSRALSRLKKSLLGVGNMIEVLAAAVTAVSRRQQCYNVIM